MNENENNHESRRSAVKKILLFLSAAASFKHGVSIDARAQEKPAGTTNLFPEIKTDADVDALVPRLSNWGRWGESDELGTLNFITPEKRRRAAALVRTGRTVSLAREVNVVKTEGIRRGQYEMMKDEGGSRDFVGMIFHGFAQTHLDALCHAFASSDEKFKRKMYNGFSTDEVTTEGANKLGIEKIAAAGVCGRGVLLDIAALKGKPLAPGTPIFVRDLEAAERRQQVRVEAGDVLFVRNGAGTANTRERRSGLHPECLIWLHRRQVALLGADGDNDAAPLAGFERWASAMHGFAIPFLGLPLLDNCELGALSESCRAEKRWSFLVTIAPWRFQGATSSPVNPLALF